MSGMYFGFFLLLHHLKDIIFNLSHFTEESFSIRMAHKEYSQILECVCELARETGRNVECKTFHTIEYTLASAYQLLWDACLSADGASSILSSSDPEHRRIYLHYLCKLYREGLDYFVGTMSFEESYRREMGHTVQEDVSEVYYDRLFNIQQELAKIREVYYDDAFLNEKINKIQEFVDLVHYN